MIQDERETTAWDRFADRLARRPLVSNLPCETIVIEAGGQKLPVTVNAKGAASTSWVASLRNAYGPYARAEARMVLKRTCSRIGAQWLSYLGERILIAAGVAGGLYLDNLPVATDLHSPSFDIQTILEAQSQLSTAFPSLPLVIRSLALEHHGALITDLLNEGFVLLPSRQVWIMDTLSDGRYRKRTDIKNDLALERHPNATHVWELADTFSQEDWRRAMRLYRFLYLERYPGFNPDYTLDFVLDAVESGWLEVHGLRNRAGVLDGVLGIIRRPGWLSCPFSGYALDAPIEQGLYRRLSLRIFMIGEEEGRILHGSAGAGRFKQTRGARPAVEYAAIHLPSQSGAVFRRHLLKGFSGALRKWAVPYLERNVV